MGLRTFHLDTDLHRRSLSEGGLRKTRTQFGGRPTSILDHSAARRIGATRRHGRCHLFVLFALLAIILPQASASVIPAFLARTTLIDTRDATTQVISPVHDEIIYDHSSPLNIHHNKRQDSASNSSGIAVDPSASAFTQPTPFDGSLGNNFTSPNCLPFFQTFLANPNFQACLPLSLLLQTSNQFFTTVRTSAAALKQTLDASCNVNATECSNLMSDLDTRLRSSSNCGPDLTRGNPIVVQATAGFQAYDVLHRAGCIKNVATGSYCYADAATNASAPNSAYVYFLPLGIALPQDARPACTQCLRETMTVLAGGAAQKGSALAANYVDAARTVGQTCGSNFAKLDVKVASVGSAAVRRWGRGAAGSFCGSWGCTAALVVVALIIWS